MTSHEVGDWEEVVTMTKPRTGSTHVLTPNGLLDVGDRRVTSHVGHTVKVVQPTGCPRNGTMGMAYVDCQTCTDASERRVFVGLVNVASLGCPRPVDHRLHTLDLNESCPHCGSNEGGAMNLVRLDELKITSEARDRIRAAIVNSFSVEEWPAQMITAYLPVCLPERSCADLAIAVGVLAASGAVPAAGLAGVLFLAELGLDGALRPVPGVLPAITAAAKGGLDTAVVAAGNAAEAALVPGTRVIAAQTLTEVIAWLAEEA
jgi:hypothetical protein